MSMRTVELVSEWDPVSFDGGYDGLRSLSDRGFSGAVTAGSTQLFMLNGTVVGIPDGDIEAFDGADGTARAAPHDALPLLVVMQDRAEAPRAQYYTEDTAISEVDRTLEDGNFTGYVELSENVLSGDYYLVYHQGRSMSVAWVGNSRKLVTDEDAFEQANDEVGIYQVMPADVRPVEIPEPPEPTTSSNDAGTAAGAATADDADESSGTDVGRNVTPDSAVADEREGTVPEAESPRTNERAVGANDTSEPDGPSSADDATATGTERTAAAATESTPSEPEAAESVAESTSREPEAVEPATESAQRNAKTADATRTERPDTSGSRTTRAGSTGASTDRPEEPVAADDDRTMAAAADSDAVGALETRSVPSLDPERSSSTPERTTAAARSQAQQSGTAADSASSQSPSARTDTTSTQESQPPESSQSASAEPTVEDVDRTAPSPELEAELEAREAEIAELEGEIRDLASENEELAAERDRLLGELEEARAEIQRLEEELAAAGGPAPSGRSLSAAEAIDGTNLFVRYHSKGEATLAKARDGSADRASVEENLRLEHHTQFDAGDAAVDGDSFEEFLHASIQYRFVDWLVRNLLYEIRDTGHENAMGVLYDALPAVDRAELNGTVSVTYTENGQEHRSQETFDVVVRDRMGNPLVVANINDARQPATEGQMADIVRNAERVGNASDSLAAAFLVTSSFFEPEALETAEEATSSGLFSRDKRKSFVNLSRKGGYHLCLLEARNDEFHLAVPEL
ncbi:hypothetical protein BRC76_01495 [Halobacteriales archaeon QH_8_67_36]|nr:MAG: hypothetical protein BRC76_01495 [Halobacteriales archaeon QH_8_67_36]